jgi:hypothetical protein
MSSRQSELICGRAEAWYSVQFLYHEFIQVHSRAKSLVDCISIVVEKVESVMTLTH